MKPETDQQWADYEQMERERCGPGLHAISVDLIEPGHYAVEVEHPNGDIEWIDCTDVDPHFGPNEPSCPGGGLDDVAFTIPPEHNDLYEICRDAIMLELGDNL